MGGAARGIPEQRMTAADQMRRGVRGTGLRGGPLRVANRRLPRGTYSSLVRDEPADDREAGVRS